MAPCHRSRGHRGPFKKRKVESSDEDSDEYLEDSDEFDPSPRPKHAKSSSKKSRASMDSRTPSSMQPADQRSTSIVYHPSTPARDATIWEQRPLMIMKHDFDRTYSDFTRSITNANSWLQDNIGNGGLEALKPINIETSPSAALQSLYEMVLGRDWRRTAGLLQASDQLFCNAFTPALISAFVVKKIFRKPLPWPTPLACLHDAQLQPVGNYLGATLRDKNIPDFEKVLREAAMRQIEDREFIDTTVLRSAAVLAEELALTLSDQLRLLRRKDLPTTGWYEKLVEDLNYVCQQALILQAKMDASQDQYYVTWPEAGQEFKQEEMNALNGTSLADREGRKICHAVLPGFRCRPVEAEKWPGYVAAQARVYVNMGGRGV